jgi:hypothetical protein
MHVHTQASTADPTWKIWKHFPMRVGQDEPRKGYLFHEDFGADFPCVPTLNAAGQLKGFSTWLDTGATIVGGGTANVSSVVVSTDGDNEACTLAHISAPVRITKGSGRKVAFGVRVKFSAISDSKNGSFLGLFEGLTPTATSHIADAGTLADKNFVGFHRLEADGDAIDIVYKADGQTQGSFTDTVVLVADTYVKLEFYFDGDQSLSFWIDGVRYTTADLGASVLGAATFPSDINLGLALVLKNATGSTPGSVTYDWTRFGYTHGDAD